MRRVEVEVPADPAYGVEAGSWVLVRVGPTWPVECYQVTDGYLEIFRGHLHRAPPQLHWRLLSAWRQAAAA